MAEKSNKEVTVIAEFSVVWPGGEMKVKGFHTSWELAQNLSRPVTVTHTDWVRIDKDKK